MKLVLILNEIFFVQFFKLNSTQLDSFNLNYWVKGKQITGTFPDKEMQKRSKYTQSCQIEKHLIFLLSHIWFVLSFVVWLDLFTNFHKIQIFLTVKNPAFFYFESNWKLELWNMYYLVTYLQMWIFYRSLLDRPEKCNRYNQTALVGKILF